jgi:transmembrane sensor
MNLSKGSAEIDAAAAEWFARREGGRWNAADQAQLEAWLDASTGNRIAYIRIHTAWERSGRLNALGAGVPAGTIPPRDSWGFSALAKASLASQENLDSDAPNDADAAPNAPKTAKVSARYSRWILWQSRSLSATVVIAAVIAVAWQFVGHNASFYSTQIGAISTVALADGSKITLNTDSQIHVALDARERRIELDQGEAFFEVAKDPARPFIVEIADKRVIAVGTKFSVRRVSNDIRVLVTEGRVKIERVGSPAKAPQTQLTAGSEARTAQAAVLVDQPAPMEVEQLLSWRTGYIVFRDTTLADAVADFNRYTVRKIFIEDPAIANIRIGGNFRSDNADAFLALIQSGFSIHIEQHGDRIVLTRR